MKGPRLHKQNFIEDGQNIIAGQLFNNPSAGDMPKIKRELWHQPGQPQQLSNSASETTELNLLR
jgi:hypothetical protein